MNEIERLEKLKSETTTACWITSQMRLNLERAYAVRDERKRIFGKIMEWDVSGDMWQDIIDFINHDNYEIIKRKNGSSWIT